MKRNKFFKGIISILLSVTMLATIMPFYVNNNNEVKAASFSITTPAANSLRPAGHIDIAWSQASGSVKNYEVYIDNTKVATVNGTSYDYYSTAVVSHKLYVKAVKNDNSTESSDTINFSVSKKGLGLASDMGRSISLKDMGVAWYYNWGENPSGGDQYKGVDYVPMIWKETNANNFIKRVNNAKNKGYKEILTFNEPDLGDQCNMSVDDVYNVWQGIDNFNGNISISSPVTAVWPQASGGWFQPFMSKLTGNDYKPDFISIHCYPDDYGGAGMARWFVEEVVDWTWNQYHIPIWITEFSTKGSVTATGGNGTKEFWETVMPLLDEREYVERYAGFCFNAAYMPNCGLWNYNTGELTPGGEMYRDLGNPEGYDPGNLPLPDYKTTIGQRNTLLDDNITINGVSYRDYIAQGGVSATASSVKYSNVAGNVIDSDIGSRWESNWSDPQNLTIDLVSSKKIKEVDIVWEDTSAAKYEIQVSNDGNNFTTVATVESNNGGRWDKTVLREQATGRYIRINGIARTTQYGYSIKDMAIYGPDNSQMETIELSNLNGGRLTTYIGTDWTTASGNIMASTNGDITAYITNGSNESRYNSIQAQYKEIKLEVGTKYKFSATLNSTVKKKVTIKLTDANGNQVQGGTTTKTIEAGDTIAVEFIFTAETDELNVAYLFGNHSGEKYTDYTFKITDNKLTDNKNYDFINGHLNIYSNSFFEEKEMKNINVEDVKQVRIFNPVTYIGESAFSGCSSLTEVTIPDGVTSIGNNAFDGCSSLTEVTIPDSVTSIGEYAFSGCSSLTEVTIPDSVASIGGGMFRGCSSLTEVTIPNSVILIREYAFSGCSSLTEVTIPDSVTGIWRNAFDGCSSLTEVTIPDSVTCIGEYAFSGCSSLTEVTIPESIKSLGYFISVDGSIGEHAFDGCSSLKEVTIPDSVTYIGGAVFTGCSSLAEVIIPDSVTYIDGAAFRGCSSLTEVTIPDSVTCIGKYAFSGCSSLTEVTIPNSVTSIWNNAFDGCSSLTEVTIPDSVTSIGKSAFWECDSLKKLVLPKKLTGEINIGLETCKSLSTVIIKAMSNTVTLANDCFTNGELKDIYIINAAMDISNTGISKDVKIHCFEYSNAYWHAKRNGNIIVLLDENGNDIETTVMESTEIVTTTRNEEVGSTEFNSDDVTTQTFSHTDVQVQKPNKLSIKKVISKKKSLKINWKRQKNIDGYNLQCALSKKFKKAKNTIIRDASKISIVIKKLKSKKKYYVRIRSYKKINGKNIYSVWSKIIAKKTK